MMRGLSRARLILAISSAITIAAVASACGSFSGSTDANDAGKEGGAFVDALGPANPVVNDGGSIDAEAATAVLDSASAQFCAQNAGISVVLCDDFEGSSAEKQSPDMVSLTSDAGAATIQTIADGQGGHVLQVAASQGMPSSSFGIMFTEDPATLLIGTIQVSFDFEITNATIKYATIGAFMIDDGDGEGIQPYGVLYTLGNLGSESGGLSPDTTNVLDSATTHHAVISIDVDPSSITLVQTTTIDGTVVEAAFDTSIDPSTVVSLALSFGALDTSKTAGEITLTIDNILVEQLQ